MALLLSRLDVVLGSIKKWEKLFINNKIKISELTSRCLGRDEFPLEHNYYPPGGQTLGYARFSLWYALLSGINF
jgi:hypothetical protein